MYGKIRTIHFVGIGGIGMSGIAEVLLNLGYRVSGSDLRVSEITQRLCDLGGMIAYGHAAENLGDADVVVTSTAVKSDNPEVIEAHRRLIPVIPRAEMLAELMRMKYGIAVAGTHGKTTTTSMVSTVLSKSGIDPTVVIGGRLDSIGSNAKLGQGKFLVAEADESDGSFLKLSPIIAVVTNVDADHLDYYSDLDEIKRTFVDFINKIPFYGVAILCLDDPNVQALIPQVGKRFVTYGMSTQADYNAQEISYQEERTTFTVCWQGERLGQLSIRMPGQHNVLNALAAVAVARELEIPFEQIAEAFCDFCGVQRRFQPKYQGRDIMVVDDYGHHPAEIKVTLAAACSGWNRRVVAVFQPHRYSRTQALFDEFVTAFYQADHLVVMDIYAAGETPIPGVEARLLAEGIAGHGHRDVHYCPDAEAVAAHLREVVQAGDLVLTLGAGNVWQIGEALAEWLQQRD
ncbi:UDP-N-acetylmuramate--alanine ligase [Syntrophotalea carbinolica DSM 2380]|uniref:UDP-N-acetylmuramate--L-alanine ligase n=1 Tax=Syntrophotalea carbinolica (strain DSM 2380 / NBRC 103641 / GraBd1) TaxID=338963 RepID=MURC_SYNC1|nr:UDP-N-acetylmuramate--L-alanine ligase [Syntrophotalea carbinolica]Q3A2G7.1 RecName: Full=UDP-N-acetylmuramate--L-alanine ligase; AltName: Full=UDP-N-acetylmuramoyl-L-alanine synthetase [Syntrophotalea carbinolica DSM 2380]ABA89440.1 UDP-N-acetylmuramate--alanine ligase [Syntrophotalea carbinolica DSM 2380]